VPVLCCFESARDIASGSTWCHRHIAAEWLEAHLETSIAEIGAPEGFDRWRYFLNLGVESPGRWRKSA
jgi:hypothetical protein